MTAEQIIAMLRDPPLDLIQMMNIVYTEGSDEPPADPRAQWREVCSNMADFFVEALP